MQKLNDDFLLLATSTRKKKSLKLRNKIDYLPASHDESR